MRLKKQYIENAGSWFGEIIDDSGACVGSSWAPSEEMIDKWYEKQVTGFHQTSQLAGTPAEYAEPPKPVTRDPDKTLKGDEGITPVKEPKTPAETPRSRRR